MIILKLVFVLFLVLNIGCGNNTDNVQTGASMENIVVESTFPIKANLVFLYYKDLAKAQNFYENTLGLERVLDYGFATIHRISETSYVGLVDETKGMHKTTEPKTVTLSFITQEIDEWNDYLIEQGVEMRHELASSKRHDTRGLVALDPEGYFLEFERFLPGDENKKLNELLSKTKAVYPTDGQVTTRPKNLGLQGTVVWLYYKDIPAAQRFYEDKFGFKEILTQGFTIVYASSATCFIGLVDEKEGLHKFSEEKSVTISFITDKIDDWYNHLSGQGLEFRNKLSDESEEPIRAFVTYDAAGYFLEFDVFLDDEKNGTLLKYLK